MAFPKHLLQQQQHRPFPPPVKPWFSRQLWENLLFYNVAVDAGALQATLPKGMLVDCYNGRGWLSIVPFQLSMGLRGFPSCFWPLTFNELNVRTYVTVNGKPGIYFYSLDANDWFSVTMARLIFKLNYFNAHIDMAIGESIFINAQRAHQGMPKSIFNAQYAPTGNIFHPKEGSLEDWLTSRWNFYCPNGDGRFIRGDIHHEAWPLQPAEVSIYENQLLTDHGLPQTIGSPTVYFAKCVHVLAWPKTIVRSLA
jgi:uncharacterized protein YqjF (DUF2071 family)